MSLPILDEDKRRKIITLVANGSSRRMAARFVGCSPSTITRTALRDQAFADQLAAAEQSAEIDALRALRIAARKDRYWRAAAWLLERKNPQDFSQRPLDLFTADEVLQLFTQLLDCLCEEIPQKNRQQALKKLYELTKTIHNEHVTPPS